MTRCGAQAQGGALRRSAHNAKSTTLLCPLKHLSDTRQNTPPPQTQKQPSELEALGAIRGAARELAAALQPAYECLKECLKFQSRAERLLGDLHATLLPLTVRAEGGGQQLHCGAIEFGGRQKQQKLICFLPLSLLPTSFQPTKRSTANQLGGAPLLVREYMRVFTNACRLVMLLKYLPCKNLVQVWVCVCWGRTLLLDTGRRKPVSL